jgi:hypothetical protein
VRVRRPSLEAYTLLADQFSAGDLSGWDIEDDGTDSGPSAWAIDAGVLRQTSNIYEPPNDRNTLSKRGTHILAGDPAWTDIILTAWLQSGDDDALGLIFRYLDIGNYYRFSMDSERGYRRLVKNVNGAFMLLWEDSFAYVPDQPYDLAIAATGPVLRGYINGVPMFVVRDADRPDGRIGLYCWANQDARFSNIRVYPADQLFANWLLADNFNAEVPGRWTFVDQTEGFQRPNWQFAGGELRQTSNAYGGSTDPGTVDKPGTFAVGGSTTWTDYRAAVRFLSDDNDGIGVMFRYVDEDNYYRFSMDRQLEYRRLIKVVQGRPTELWADNVRYAIGREYIVTVDCIGSSLTGYLDGVELFSVEDGDLSNGSIALYCWRNTGARFREVLVAAPGWSEYYAFNAEVTLPAATHIRIHSGALTDPHDTDLRLVRRFVAGPGEGGRIRFGDSRITLRVVGPAGAGRHQRSFLSESNYVDEDVRVLRKADGTGFFVVPTAAARFAAGQYRLRMIYRRDNTAVDSGSQILRQAGDSSPESAWIDVPWQS